MKAGIKTIGGLLTAAVVIVGLFVVVLRTPPVQVDLVEIRRAPMQITINVDGTTRIRDVFEIAAPLAGRAQRAPVHVGDTVLANETVVARVEPAAPALLDTRSRTEAEARVREAEAAVRLASSERRKAEEDLAYAQSQFDRIQALVERNVASLTQLEAAQRQLAVAEAAMQVAISGVAMAQETKAQAEAALITQDPDSAGSSGCCVEIRAPITGTVLSVEVASARPVVAGERLLSVGDPADLEISADLLSYDAVRIAPGARAIVERWGGEGALEARLSRIDPIAYTKVSALGIEEQRVDAIFDFVSPPEERAGLGHNFSVFLRVVEWEAEDILQVPLNALFREGDAWAVYRVGDDGIARKTEVEIARRNQTAAQVVAGLSAGDRVIAHPPDSVSDGAEVVQR